MKWCLVEVTSYLQQPQYTLHTLRLALATFHHQHPRRFMTHCGSPIYTHPIKPTTTRAHATYTINTQAKKIIKIKSIATKIEKKIYFGIFLWKYQWSFNNNRSFHIKNQMYLLVYYFIIHLNHNGYLIIIILVTYASDAANKQGVEGAALIVCLIKNNYNLHSKSCVVLNFGNQSSHYMNVIMILLIQFMLIYKILLIHHYLKEYQLYQNLVLLLYNNTYNRYKHCMKHTMVLKFLSKNIKESMFYCWKAVVRSNTILLWYSKYVYIL